MEEKKRPKLVFKLPSEEKKAAAEVKATEEIQSFGSSSTDHPVDRTEIMEKLENGGKDCDAEGRSSRFCIKLRRNRKKSSGTDQEKQPRVEQVSEENSCNDHQQQLRVEKTSEENNSNGLEQQSSVGKFSDLTSDDQEDRKIIKTAENQDAEKMGALGGELSQNFKLDDAEGKGKRKRKRGFTMALSKEQIEEDILEWLGSEAPKKRAKKKGYKASEHPLTHLFPAAWMESLIDY